MKQIIKAHQTDAHKRPTAIIILVKVGITFMIKIVARIINQRIALAIFLLEIIRRIPFGKWRNAVSN